MPRAAKNKNGQFRFIVNHPEGDEVPSGVPRPQAGRPFREWGGARHRHVHLPLLLHLLDEADHVQAQIVEAETYDDSLMWKETKGSYSCHCVTCCAVLYAINF